MNDFIPIAARMVRGARNAYDVKWIFLGVFVLTFFTSALALAQLDLLPSVSVTEGASVLASQTPSAPVTPVAELPEKIEIPKINLTATITNPDTTDIPTLDDLLLKGAVRYPTSANLGVAGNVILFAHSSYLPVVGNPAYKIFDGIQKLHAGDTITVSSADVAYEYEVVTVSKESANDAAIPLSVAGKKLTLATCDSFGTKTDRFVVVADFVESHALPL